MTHILLFYMIYVPLLLYPCKSRQKLKRTHDIIEVRQSTRALVNQQHDQEVTWMTEDSLLLQNNSQNFSLLSLHVLSMSAVVDWGQP